MHKDSHSSHFIGTVQLNEKSSFGHLVLRGSVTNKTFMKTAKACLSTALPNLLKMISMKELSVFWISPDEWLILIDAPEMHDLEKKFHQSFGALDEDCHYALTDVSGGQSIFTLEGTDAINVLKKISHYDFGNSNFPIGKVVTTSVAKSQAVIYRTSDVCWELVVRSSFKDYLWHVIDDACEEFRINRA